MPRRILALVLTATLVAAGCGDDDSTSDPPTSSSAPVSTTAGADDTDETTTTTTTSTTSTTTTTTTVPVALDQAAAEAAMASFVEATAAPGVLVGVQIGDDEPILLAAGIDDADAGTALLPDRLFRVGSVSKPLLATVLFDAVDAGQLSLDDQIGSLIDGVTNPEATIEQVLAHDAGLANWDALGDAGIQTLLVPNLTRDWEPDEIVDEVKDLPAHAEPGNGFHYSNPGYQMLGAIVEDATGESIDASIDRVLGEEQGLADIAFGPFDETPENLIYAYGNLAGSVLESRAIPAVGIDSLFYTTGAGYSDLDDLVAFSRLFWGVDGLLAPPDIDVTDDHSGGYGFATQILDNDWFGHSGDVFGSRTLATHHRGLDITVVLNANSNEVTRDETIDLARAVLDAIG